MNGWQLTIIILVTINITVAGLKHGEPRGNYSFGGQLLDAGVLLWILIEGGFFK